MDKSLSEDSETVYIKKKYFRLHKHMIAEITLNSSGLQGKIYPRADSMLF